VHAANKITADVGSGALLKYKGNPSDKNITQGPGAVVSND
jgi:hypothetical protein